MVVAVNSTGTFSPPTTTTTTAAAAPAPTAATEMDKLLGQQPGAATAATAEIWNHTWSIHSLSPFPEPLMLSSGSSCEFLQATFNEAYHRQQQESAGRRGRRHKKRRVTSPVPEAEDYSAAANNSVLVSWIRLSDSSATLHMDEKQAARPVAAKTTAHAADPPVRTETKHPPRRQHHHLRLVVLDRDYNWSAEGILCFAHFLEQSSPTASKQPQPDDDKKMFIISFAFLLARGKKATCERLWKALGQVTGGGLVSPHAVCPSPHQLMAVLTRLVATTTTARAVLPQTTQQQQQQAGIIDTGVDGESENNGDDHGQSSSLACPSVVDGIRPNDGGGGGAPSATTPLSINPPPAAAVLLRPLHLTFSVPPTLLPDSGLETLTLTVPPASLRHLYDNLLLCQPCLETEKRHGGSTMKEKRQQGREKQECLPLLEAVYCYLEEAFCINVRSFALTKASCGSLTLGCDGRCKFWLLDDDNDAVNDNDDNNGSQQPQEKRDGAASLRNEQTLGLILNEVRCMVAHRFE